MSNLPLYFDVSEFNRDLKKIVENATPKLIRKGLFEAMNELLNDAVRLPPQAPKNIGTLWASKSNTVSIKKQGNYFIIEGGFNIKYARRWHEAEPGIHWTRNKGASQPGPKYLESKMATKKEKYLGIVAETIRRGQT